MTNQLSEEQIKSVEWLWTNPNRDSYLIEIDPLPNEKESYVIVDSLNGIMLIENNTLYDYVIEQMKKHGKRIIPKSNTS